eukprot:7787642-Ditylum_brightwellii.AAC.1
MPPWGSTVSIDEILVQKKHFSLPYESYGDYFEQQCNKYDYYFDMMLGSISDSMLNAGLVTPSNTMKYKTDVRALVAENYSHFLCDMTEPVTPTTAQDIIQRYFLLVMDETHALIFDAGIQPPLQKALAGLSEQMQVKGEGKVQWQLCDDYGHVRT